MRNMTRFTALLNAVLAAHRYRRRTNNHATKSQYPSVAAAGRELRPERHRHEAANDATGLACVLDQQC